MAPTFTPYEPFRPAPGLSNPHVQTILSQFIRPLAPREIRRERWETPDGDFLDVDLLDAPKGAPWLFVIHGLEGSSRSGYVAAMFQAAKSRGWGALGFNFRSCSGEPNRVARSYCSGEVKDPLFAVERLRASGVTGPLLGIGFSLGGNVLLKLLADTGAASPLHAAVAVSTPYDLDACAAALDGSRGLSSLYRRVFLGSLKSKALEKARRFPELLDPELIRAAKGIRQFDDAVTARLYGFADAADYYRQCASAFVLDHIRRPTLLVSSSDDPVAPLNGEHGRSQNPSLHWLVTSHGGHVGFIAGERGNLRFWAERVAADYLAWTLSEQAMIRKPAAAATAS